MNNNDHQQPGIEKVDEFPDASPPLAHQNGEEISLLASITAPGALVVLSLALLVSGRWVWAIFALAVAVLCQAASDIEEKEKLAIRFNILTVGDIFKEMLRWESHYLYECQQQQEQQKGENSKLWKEGQVIVLEGLATQIRKYEKDDSETSALIGQESGFLAIRRFPKDEVVMISAFSLLSLVAKNGKVRERILSQPETFGLHRCVRVLRDSLQRAKSLENNPEDVEIVVAELLQKGFLLLGAVSDGSRALAGRAVQEGGADLALDALDWFRCHSSVVKWALWDLFIVCYEEPWNKIPILQNHGLPKIIEAMRNSIDNLDVSRHGIALLFDLLREETATTCPPNHTGIDIWKIRESARLAGLHDLVLKIIDTHHRDESASDVVMMGNELLTGTGYQKATASSSSSSSVQIEELD